VKTDVAIAKNYLKEIELADMGQLMNIVFGSLPPHLFGSFEFTHQSRSPLRSFFMNPKKSQKSEAQS